MIQGISSSPSSDLSLEDTLEIANYLLEGARKAKNKPAVALAFCNDAKSKIEDAERIFSKKCNGSSLNEGIAGAYHEHAQLLGHLENHNKARKSHSKAQQWGHVNVMSQQIGSSQPSGIFCIIPPAVLTTSPLVAAAKYQGMLDSSIRSPLQYQVQDPIGAEIDNTTSPASDNIPRNIFGPCSAPPVLKYTLPEAGARITSTPQLAYCLSLLRPTPVSKDGLDEVEFEWSQAKVADPDEHVRLNSMATDMVRAFVRDELKKLDVVAEVVCLAAVLDQEDFRKVFQVFVDGIEQSMLLKVHLLDGLVQLIRNAAPGYIDADDLVKILELLNKRLKGTHQQSTKRVYQLATTMSRVLDAMIDSQVKGLSREQLHEPLSVYLKELQESSNPSLVYQAAYAYQALLYIPDDETILQTMLRRTGKVVQGISGVVSAVKALDLSRFIEGLQNIQGGLASAESAIELVQDAFQKAKALTESGQGFLKCLKEGFSFDRKSAWFPALRGLDALLQEGRLSEFEKLIREAPCRQDPEFQWGVCQRLGEIASNTLWGTKTRQCAIALLGELYIDDSERLQVDVKKWLLQILTQLTVSSDSMIAVNSRDLLQQLGDDYSTINEADYSGSYQLLVARPLQASPLLDHIQNKPDVELDLNRLKRERLKGQEGDVYISPRARANLGATEYFDLTSKVQEFLDSDRKVFLLLGDSGAGKSTFNRTLEANLWDNYKTHRRIPIFTYLPSIDKPEHELISKQLSRTNFTEEQIRELKAHREFILICDGYDESQQTQNLYMSNQLNQTGGWRAQMVISCRTEYNGVDYKDRFRPNNGNIGGKLDLFQEAIIAPFSQDQIQDYIDQYVSSIKPSWGSQDYQQAIKQIPNLQDLVKNPFLLRLTIDVIPRLVDIRDEFSTVHVSRIELYDEFVAHWLERSKIRLGEMELSSRDKEAFRILSDVGFKQHGIMYLKDLAVAVYDNQGGNPVVKYSEYRDQRTWKASFFSKKSDSCILQEAIPLVRNGDQYRFIHKSVLEYALTLAIFDPSKQDEYKETPPVSSRRESIDSVASFEIPILKEKTPNTPEQSLLDSPLAKKSFVSDLSILQFLVERAQQQLEFRDQLHTVIQQSKIDKAARVAAANAITVLVKAGVHFIEADLRGINIPGADLSNGVFDSVRFDGSDLRKVNLQGAWLRKASFNGAQMKGVQFGELPFLQEKGGVLICAYSRDGKTLAVGLDNGDISLYETSGWKRVGALKGHSERIKYLIFSTTSNLLLSRSGDTTARLWDINIGNCIHPFEGHDGDITCVAYSPKGDRVATGSNDNSIRLWGVETGSCILILLGHDDEVISVLFSPKGDRIVSESKDHTMRLWDVNSGNCIRTLTDYWVFSAIAYSPNGDQVAFGTFMNDLRLWDVETGDCTLTTQRHSNDIETIKYSLNGDQIASASRDKTIRLWDVKASKCLHILQGHNDRVIGIEYSPKGDQLASWSNDNTVRLWDLDTGYCVRTLKGYMGSLTSIVYSPKGNQLASGSWNGTVRLWDLKAGNGLQTLQDHSNGIISIVCPLKKDRFFSGSLDQTVKLWDAETGNCIYTIQGLFPTNAPVVYSPQRDLIAAENGSGILKLWDAETGTLVHNFLAHHNGILSIAYSPAGNQISSSSYDMLVKLWDVETGTCVHTLQGHSGYIRTVVYSPRENQIASGSEDTTVRLWEVETGNCVHTLQGHSKEVWAIAYSPKGDQLASASEDHTLKLWDVENGSCIHTLQGHCGEVHSVAYSPDRNQIASGSCDKTVRLWSIDTGLCIHTLEGHEDEVTSIAYSLKGDMIASGSDDKTARLWSTGTGQCLVSISGFYGVVYCVTWDDQYLVTGSIDKSVRRWQIVKEGDEHKACLCWSSSHMGLTVSEAMFDDMGGINNMLLTQHGALINATPASE